jgi:hypothetical protein
MREPDPDRAIVIHGVFQTDRQPQHPFRHPGLAELIVGVSPLRREHRHADQAFDAAEARCAFDQFQVVVQTFGAIVSAAEIEAHHSAETGHLPPGDLVVRV